MTCNCEFCEPCKVCGHKADEHLAGDGNCFICNCTSFNGTHNRILADFGFISESEYEGQEVLKQINKEIDNDDKWPPRGSIGKL